MVQIIQTFSVLITGPLGLVVTYCGFMIRRETSVTPDMRGNKPMHMHLLGSGWLTKVSSGLPPLGMTFKKLRTCISHIEINSLLDPNALRVQNKELENPCSYSIFKFKYNILSPPGKIPLHHQNLLDLSPIAASKYMYM